jgi:hypothetical protein
MDVQAVGQIRAAFVHHNIENATLWQRTKATSVHGTCGCELDTCTGCAAITLHNVAGQGGQ